MLDDALTDLQQRIAALERELGERTAERDARAAALREAREQQTATAEVLQVINSSPGNIAPVFEAILEKATRLCEADFGVLWRYDGERFEAVAVRGAPPAFADFLARGPINVPPESGMARVVHGEPAVHFLDAAAPEHTRGVRGTLAELSGARSYLAVPLVKD